MGAFAASEKWCISALVLLCAGCGPAIAEWQKTAEEPIEAPVQPDATEPPQLTGTNLLLPASALHLAPSVAVDANVTVTLPTSNVTLTAATRGFRRPDVRFAWTQLSGPSTSLQGADTSAVTVSGLVAGSYTLRVVATDGTGESAEADAVITVHPAPSAAITTERQLGSTGAPYGYVEYLPAGYAEATSAFPVLIVLHGIGEEGNGTTQLGSVRINGPNAEIDHEGAGFPMVILTPQSPTWWDVSTLDAFVSYALAHYRVDPKRVYLTGLSMGGGGTWDYAAEHADRLAAIIPICGASGGANDARAANLVSNGVAIWAAHAMDDGVVNIATTRDWMTSVGHALGAGSVALLDNYPSGTSETKTARVSTSSKTWTWTSGQDYRDASGSPWPGKQLVTLYPSGGHAIWDRMYSDGHVYEWLLTQARP